MGTRLALEFRSRGSGEGESVHVQEESYKYLSIFFQNKGITLSLQAIGGCFPLSIKPCTCTLV